MKRFTSLLALGAATLLAPQLAAQHVQATAVANDPNTAGQVWVCNRDNDSVSVVDVLSGSLVTEIAVGRDPRTLAFSADGTEVFVVNKRGNIPRTRHFLTPFLGDGSEMRGSISVINAASKLVTDTIPMVGVEPFGIVVAPNGEFFAVTGFRSGTVKFFDTASPYNELLSFTYDWNLNNLPAGVNYTDADEDNDFVADLSQPRFITMASNNTRLFVSHSVSPWVSVLDLTLDGNSQPDTVTLTKKISLDDYPFDQLVFEQTPGGDRVQTIKSQGLPRFLGDVALSPDGTRAVVPHLLANQNHDVTFNFGPSLPGDFANRIYPAITVFDASNLSYNEALDNSARLHHELADPVDPAANVPYGGQGGATADGLTMLGGVGQPVIGGQLQLQLSGINPLDISYIVLGDTEQSVPMGTAGTLLCNTLDFFKMPGGTKTFNIPNNPGLDGVEVCWQAVVFKGPLFGSFSLSSGIRTRVTTAGYGTFGDNQMGHRAGHPEYAQWHGNDRVLVLNRGSEDVFLYDASGSDLRLMSVFPPRNKFVERAAFDTSTPLGDLPLGFTMWDDPATGNDDSIVSIVNEVSRTLSVLRVDWLTGVITQEKSQIGLLAGADKKTLSERTGIELFEDASRAQTAGRFNNSCGSCHFEGGDDRVAWARPAGPRSTMPLYGGIGASGRLLWKSVRLHLGETGPMFGGENGGTGIFTDAERQSLIDVHEDFAVPLNPSIDESTGQLTAAAARGQDLFFGTNNAGFNPTGRSAGCAECHAIEELSDPFGETERFFTIDKLASVLTDDPNGVENLDPNCTQLAQNVSQAAGFRDVNTAVNIDEDFMGGADPDRNLDGIIDIESYEPQNPDTDDDFGRDDPNSWLCPVDGVDEMGPLKTFLRTGRSFSVPTKLGVFASGPYFHDHVASSLRALLDPALQADQSVIVDYDRDGNPANDTHPLFSKYSDGTFPTLNKIFNDVHDIRGNELFVASQSKVQLTLVSASEAIVQGVSTQAQIDADIEEILAFIQSL